MSRPSWVHSRDDEGGGILRELADGMRARIYAGEHSMLSIVRVAPHTRGTIHSHPEEQWGVLLEGACTRIQGGEEVAVEVGDFWHTPGNVRHGVRTGERAVLILDIFSPARPEYRRPDAGFGTRDTR